MRGKGAVQQLDAVEVGAIVCLIDMDAKKPEGAGTETKATVETETPKVEVQPTATKTTYASGTASPAAKKVLAEKGIATSEIKGIDSEDNELTFFNFSFVVFN